MKNLILIIVLLTMCTPLFAQSTALTDPNVSLILPKSQEGNIYADAVASVSNSMPIISYNPVLAQSSNTITLVGGTIN